jgi:DNA polymerase-1
MILADRVRANSQLALLLDCNGICHALSHTVGELSHNGMETGIIFGFLLQLFTLQKRFHPHRWVFAWDSRLSLRKHIYSQYKGNRAIKRSPQEEDLRSSVFRQFDLLRINILPSLGFDCILYVNGYEADDLLACAVGQIGGKKVIVSQDHDLYQLLGEHCTMYNSRTRSLFTETDFRTQYGINPEQWVEVKAIAGCPGDNVQGILHVGEATAIKYLTGQLSYKSKTYASIRQQWWDQVQLNRRLVRLPFEGCQAATKGSFSDGYSSSLSEEGFRRVCREHGFESFLAKEKYEEWGKLFRWK